MRPNRRMLFGFAAALPALFRAKAQPLPTKSSAKEIARNALTGPQQSMEAVLVEVTSAAGARPIFTGMPALSSAMLLSQTNSGRNRSTRRRDNRLLRMRCSRRKAFNPKRDLGESDVRDILVQAMADVGADPALIYVFQRTGIYICDENEKRLTKESLKAFDAALDKYFAALNRRPQ